MQFLIDFVHFLWDSTESSFLACFISFNISQTEIVVSSSSFWKS